MASAGQRRRGKGRRQPAASNGQQRRTQRRGAGPAGGGGGKVRRPIGLTVATARPGGTGRVPGWRLAVRPTTQQAWGPGEGQHQPPGLSDWWPAMADNGGAARRTRAGAAPTPAAFRQLRQCRRRHASTAAPALLQANPLPHHRPPTPNPNNPPSHSPAVASAAMRASNSARAAAAACAPSPYFPLASACHAAFMAFVGFGPAQMSRPPLRSTPSVLASLSRRMRSTST